MTLPGWVPQDELHRTLSGARVGVVPSVWPEPLGAVGIEMLRHGLPVVGFDVGGISEWLKDGVNGYLVPVFDRARLAERIDALLADPELARRLGQAGREQAATWCDEERNFAVVPDVLRDGQSAAPPRAPASRATRLNTPCERHVPIHGPRQRTTRADDRGSARRYETTLSALPVGGSTVRARRYGRRGRRRADETARSPHNDYDPRSSTSAALRRREAGQGRGLSQALRAVEAKHARLTGLHVDILPVHRACVRRLPPALTWYELAAPPRALGDARTSIPVRRQLSQVHPTEWGRLLMNRAAGLTFARWVLREPCASRREKIRRVRHAPAPEGVARFG